MKITKLIEVVNSPLSNNEKQEILNKISLEANKWLARNYPDAPKFQNPFIIINNKDYPAHILGVYSPKNNSIGISNVLVQAYLKTGSFHYIMETLKHELIHFALFNRNPNSKDYQDGNEVFESELKKHKLLSNFQVHYGEGYSLYFKKKFFSKNKFAICLITNKLTQENIFNLKQNRFSCS